MYTEKLKRSPTHNDNTSLHFARLFFSLVLVYALIAVLHPPFMGTWYTILAGMTMMFFWPCTAFCMMLALVWKQHRMRGDMLKAHATKWTLAAMCLFMVSALRLTFFTFV
ncbi:MAG: hypothetical protein AAFR81_00970 [Chloroflexota bacterium]